MAIHGEEQAAVIQAQKEIDARRARDKRKRETKNTETLKNISEALALIAEIKRVELVEKQSQRAFYRRTAKRALKALTKWVEAETYDPFGDQQDL